MKKILLTALLLLATVSNAEHYKVIVKGQSAGKAELIFTHSDNAYQSTLTLYPNMLAKLFGIDDMQERASGVFNNGHYYPKSYSRKTLKGEELLSVKFNGTRVTGKKEGENKNFSIHALGQDPLSQIAQITYDLAHGKTKARYYLVTERYQQEYIATITKNTHGNHVFLKQKNGSRAIELQFNAQGVLLRMTKFKKGKKQFDMSIK